MKKINSAIAIFVLLVLVYACDDIVEEDITDNIVQIIAPTEGSVIEGNTANFSWINVNGADQYRIQIASSVQTTILDSLVTGTTFNYTINPGTYSWRVKGVNFAYETAYTFPHNFTVESSENLTNQNLTLLTPEDAIYTNNSTFTFTWSPIVTADSYTFELIRNNGGQQTIVGPIVDITTGSYAITDVSIFNIDAEYIWKVKAVNTTSETPNSQRSIFIDRVAPNQPVLMSPNDMETTTDLVVTFNWANGTDTGNLQSSITNTIEIATDINFNTIIETFQTENNTYQYTFASTGTYYWRVKAADAAGNTSDASIIRTIEIQ